MMQDTIRTVQVFQASCDHKMLQRSLLVAAHQSIVGRPQTQLGSHDVGWHLQCQLNGFATGGFIANDATQFVHIGKHPGFKIGSIPPALNPVFNESFGQVC